MLPFAIWFIYYFINSELLPSAVSRVVMALVTVFLFFYVVERLSLWLSKFQTEQCLIATFDNTRLRLVLDVQADFLASKLLSVSFSDKAIFNVIRLPNSKNVIRVTTTDGVSELPTNFCYAPLQAFLQQVNATVQKQYAK